MGPGDVRQGSPRPHRIHLRQQRGGRPEGVRGSRFAAGNFINDKPTGAVVAQQPFGGARASGTNKAEDRSTCSGISPLREAHTGHPTGLGIPFHAARVIIDKVQLLAPTAHGDNLLRGRLGDDPGPDSKFQRRKRNGNEHRIHTDCKRTGRLGYIGYQSATKDIDDDDYLSSRGVGMAGIGLSLLPREWGCGSCLDPPRSPTTAVSTCSIRSLIDDPLPATGLRRSDDPRPHPPGGHLGRLRQAG